MTKLEAIIQNSKLEAVKTALHEVGVEGMTVIEVRGHGRQKGHTEVYRGREYSVDLIPKTKLEMVLPDAIVEKAVQAILGTARTGKIGDGKIFLSRIDEAIRIRNDERGEGALCSGVTGLKLRVSARGEKRFLPGHIRKASGRQRCDGLPPVASVTG